MRRRAFTLVELLVVIAILALLISITAGATVAVKAKARQIVYASHMRDVHAGLMAYAVENGQRFPPFAFSEAGSGANLAQSGHWGGVHQKGDPAALGRWGVDRINLWALIDARYLASEAVLCPSARSAGVGEPYSYFPYSRRFSTYCLRVPYSQDLFRGSEHLVTKFGLMGIYRLTAGGQRDPTYGQSSSTVPQVRVDRAYASAAPGVTHVAEMASAAWLADGFWPRGGGEPTGSKSGLTEYPRRAEWWHGSSFNVLTGDGAVNTVIDDGTVAAHSPSASGAVPPGGGPYNAYHAEAVWQYFDLKLGK